MGNCVRILSTSFVFVFAALIVAIGPASADMFTFTTEAGEQTAVGTTTPQGSVGGSTWTAKGTTTFADGRTATADLTCISLVQPPNDSIFFMHFACDGTGADGSYTSYGGCNKRNEEGTELGCVGGLIGTGGDYEGRTGAFTSQGTGGSGSGTGQWYK